MISINKHEKHVRHLGFCDGCDVEILLYGYTRSLDLHIISTDMSRYVVGWLVG